ncbi:MAG: hypothetical protein ACOY3X_08535 [Pseudomonadota bacterium]
MKALTENQYKAATMLAEGRKSCDVAKEIGVTPETISHWKLMPAFDAYRSELQRQAVNECIERIRALHGLALDTLEDQMKSSTSPAARVRAAQVLLQYGSSLSDNGLILLSCKGPFISP